MRHHLLLLTATILPLGLPCGALQAEDLMLSGASISYATMLSGQMKIDGKSRDWDSGQRVELHLRDYYYEQQSHHPFAEIGFFYEDHNSDADGIDVDAETIALRVAVGSAIPLWRSLDGNLSAGVSPELGAHIGTFSIDVRNQGLKSDDDSFRYGASAGISGWLAINRSFSVGLGLIGSYWRATEVDFKVPTGQGSETESTNPSGWDLGARLSVGFLF